MASGPRWSGDRVPSGPELGTSAPTSYGGRCWTLAGSACDGLREGLLLGALAQQLVPRATGGQVLQPLRDPRAGGVGGSPLDGPARIFGCSRDFRRTAAVPVSNANRER